MEERTTSQTKQTSLTTECNQADVQVVWPTCDGEDMMPLKIPDDMQGFED